MTTKKARKQQDGWRGTNVREELARLIEQLTPHWRINEFVDVAVREKLERDEAARKGDAP